MATKFKVTTLKSSADKFRKNKFLANIAKARNKLGAKFKQLSPKNKIFLRVSLIVLFLGIAGSSAVALLLPYLPGISFWLNPPDQDQPKFKDLIEFAKGDDPIEIIPAENRLLIPKIGVDTAILEGSTLDVLKKSEGVWREPVSNNPEQPGNMVIAGHRFQYLPPNTATFYNLDKIKKDDDLFVFWNKKLYVYKVIKKSVVLPHQTDIRLDDPKVPNELTIYTCTPLGSNAKRLVVEAKLVKTTELK